MQLNTVKIGTKYAMFPKTKRTISEQFILLQNKQCFLKQNQRLVNGFIFYFIAK